MIFYQLVLSLSLFSPSTSFVYEILPTSLIFIFIFPLQQGLCMIFYQLFLSLSLSFPCNKVCVMCMIFHQLFLSSMSYQIFTQDWTTAGDDRPTNPPPKLEVVRRQIIEFAWDWSYTKQDKNHWDCEDKHSLPINPPPHPFHSKFKLRITEQVKHSTKNIWNLTLVVCDKFPVVNINKYNKANKPTITTAKCH